MKKPKTAEPISSWSQKIDLSQLNEKKEAENQIQYICKENGRKRNSPQTELGFTSEVLRSEDGNNIRKLEDHYHAVVYKFIIFFKKEKIVWRWIEIIARTRGKNKKGQNARKRVGGRKRRFVFILSTGFSTSC